MAQRPARLAGATRARARAGGPRDHACFARRCAKADGCRSRLLARCGGKPCRNLNAGARTVLLRPGQMSCSCLPIFGKKKQPRSPAADSAPASDARTPAPGGQKPPSREQGAAQAAQDATSLSGLWEEVPSTRGAHDASVVGMGRTGKTGAREGISPSDVNGRFDAQVPDWVQKAAVPGAAGEQERIGVMGEVGSIHHGSGDGFQTRATPRSVFRKAEQNSGRCGGGEDGGVPAGRPPRPPAVSGGSDAAGVSVSDWVQVVDARKESQVFAARNMTASLMQGLDGLPDHRNGLLDHRAHAAAEGEVLVRDSDPQCIPGAEVQVSKRWQDVPYFKQFHGVGGKLTRRGVNGATWYAAFTGCPEQAFSTGMHGQYILCYAPVRLHAWQYMHRVHGSTCSAILTLASVHAPAMLR